MGIVVTGCAQILEHQCKVFHHYIMHTALLSVHSSVHSSSISSPSSKHPLAEPCQTLISYNDIHSSFPVVKINSASGVCYLEKFENSGLDVLLELLTP